MQKEVIISNQGMSASDVLEIARHNAVVKLSDTALSAMAASRAYIDALVASSQPVYGVSTGFGALANRYVSVEQRAQLQRSLELTVVVAGSAFAAMGAAAKSQLVVSCINCPCVVCCRCSQVQQQNIEPPTTKP